MTTLDERAPDGAASGLFDDLQAGCLHTLVARCAAEMPDAPAVVSDDEGWDYARLVGEAAAIADRLRADGIGPEDRVAVAMIRSPLAFAAFLGVLAAGAAYVPLDPDYPVERVRFVLQDAAVSAVLTQRSLRRVLRGVDVPVHELEPTGAYATSAAALEGADVGPDNLAYVVYTSGSTGTPKGVMIDHAAVTSLVRSDERLAVQPGDVVAQYAPTSFDASVFEIWSALCRGAQVAVLPGGEVSVERLSGLLRQWRPDWLFLTTGLFHVVVDHDPAALASVRTLITGGDVLSPQHVATASSIVPSDVYAAYGPTETTVFASLHRASAATGEQARVPIGAPLDGVTMRVLDENLRELAAGEVGELYIGGCGVGRGYLDRPGMTASRFVPDPESSNGQRLYRSGDLAARLPDGEVEFRGRRDRQVKIRGFRVELGEIEAVLNAHPDVGGAAALAWDVEGGNRLAAYAAPAAGATINASEVRAWLRQRLPGFMVPGTCLVLDSMPLDPNDKVDRSALPEPWGSRLSRDDLLPYEAPTTSVERTIAEVWAEALGLDKVGRNDNFYELGGDSLRSVDTIERLRPHGLGVSAGDFFRNQTVAELARVVSR